MTIRELIKILDNKIRHNKADFDLHRQNAKIPALSSTDLNKYEYLSGEDLGYRPGPVQKAKFEYSSLSEVFNKGLDPNEKNKGISTSKRIKTVAKNFNESNYGKIFVRVCKLAGKQLSDKIISAAVDLAGSRIADKITSLKVSDNQELKEEIKEEEIIIPPHQRQKIISDLRLF